MLILSRKRNEKIRIGTDIVLTVIRIQGDKTRIAIEAPNHIQIHREEVFKAIAENGTTRELASPTAPTSIEDQTVLALLDLLVANGYHITDEIRKVVDQCSQDFSSLIFLVKG